MHSHRITEISAVKRFVLGGNARFTLVSARTGTRFTYRARAGNPFVGGGVPTFVAVLTGADNTGDYTFLGTIFPDGSYRHGARSTISQTAASATAFAWFHAIVAEGKLPDTLEFWHEGRCGRCGRALTVPGSIATGFGPECADILGVDPVAVPADETGDPMDEFTLEIQAREADEERRRGLPEDYR